ncbi:MAG: hypothetical protein UY92_C0015G0026 [Candidatus Magasanikbacteria bacterium GW2011_GWA2_56_11]|uniref:Phosphoglycerate mutase n=1 Tax=Candidatus Magasanikbacteria bacterium GW2011_GWA2_56_11 TaxID=1619044 RepID=A0A0G2B879_9BACT|nr:MAG: hypothetical protein UY92_C0015G0026 [Candidatus Magasanikbacteria bacterium GW2011_GWA2_56_11]
MPRTSVFHLFCLRHPRHNVNVVSPADYAQVRELGKRLAKRELAPLKVWISSPAPRAIAGGLALMEGTGVMLPLKSAHSALGDITMGQYPFSTSETALLKQLAAEKHGGSLEGAILYDPAFTDKTRFRGTEACDFVMEVMGAMADSQDSPTDEPIGVLISSHGGRIEPLLAQLAGADVQELFPEPVSMATLTVAIVTYDHDTRKFDCDRDEVKYLGTLEPPA